MGKPDHRARCSAAAKRKLLGLGCWMLAMAAAAQVTGQDLPTVTRAFEDDLAQRGRQQQTAGADLCNPLTILGVVGETPGGLSRFPPGYPATQSLALRYDQLSAQLQQAFKDHPPLNDCLTCVFARASVRIEMETLELKTANLHAELSDLNRQLRATQDPAIRRSLQQQIAMAEGQLADVRRRYAEDQAAMFKWELQEQQFKDAVGPIGAAMAAIDKAANDLYAKLCPRR